MKCALLVEHDPQACGEIAALLKSLGYIVATTDSPRAALNTAQTVRFDLILTYTTFNADDRRSFLGEITRLAPQAPVVLLLDDESQVPHYHAGRIAPLPSMPAYATQPLPHKERRRQSQRRMRPR